MSYLIPPSKPVSLPVAGSPSRFPVRRIYCVGKNYADHVLEMGGDLKSSEPVIFTKDATTLVETGSEIAYPKNTQELHHEVELVVAMGETGIFGYAVGLDMTRRDVQASAKSKGGPWDRAKNFPLSAPCGALTPARDFNPSSASISLDINGRTRQSSTLDKMIWSVEEIITFLSNDLDLQAGDLIFTGTPEGVGPVKRGDRLLASITGLSNLEVTYV